MIPSKISTAPSPATADVGQAAAEGEARTRLPVALRTLLRNREIQRLAQFLVAGGFSAVITLSVTSGLNEYAHVAFLWAAIAGTELGILVNFALNDGFAFRDLEGHHRSFLVRVARFHVTVGIGQSLILGASLILHDAAHWRPVFAQAVPIVLVTGFNFLMHRFWTYRQAH
jgi:putative flippase GtrA